MSRLALLVLAAVAFILSLIILLAPGLGQQACESDSDCGQISCYEDEKIVAGHCVPRDNP